LTNKKSIVNEKIAFLLSTYPPEPHIVQNYMIRICKQYEVGWKPNSIMAQPLPSNPIPSSYSASSSISALAVRSTMIQQDCPGISKSDWVDEYDFYNIQTVDGVVSATVEGSLSPQNKNEREIKVIPVTPEAMVEAVLVDEQPSSKKHNKFAHKHITYDGSSFISNGKEDIVYLEQRPSATAPIEHKPTTLSMPEPPNSQQQESEKIVGTERSAGTSTFQNNISSVSKNSIIEVVPAEQTYKSVAYANATRYQKKEQSLQKRLDILQKDHKDREQKNSQYGSLPSRTEKDLFG